MRATETPEIFEFDENQFQIIYFERRPLYVYVAILEFLWKFVLKIFEFLCDTVTASVYKHFYSVQQSAPNIVSLNLKYSERNVIFICMDEV